MVFWFGCRTVFLREICVDSPSTKFCRRALVLYSSAAISNYQKTYIYKVFVHANGNGWLKQNYTIMQGSLCRYSPIIKELPFLIILGYTVIYTIIKKKIHTIVEKNKTTSTFKMVVWPWPFWNDIILL